MAASRTATEEAGNIFEIVDFTTASPWETFTAELEKALRNWGLHAPGAERKTPENVVHMALFGREYMIEFVTAADSHGRSSTSPSTYTGVDIARALQEEFHHDVPGPTSDLLCTNFDFDESSHTLSQRYGCRTFVLLKPVSTKYSNSVSPSEARLLLSSLTIAANNTNCSLPVFAQVGNLKRHNFMGYSSAGGIQTQFDGVYRPSTPRAYAHITGLLGLFRERAAIDSAKASGPSQQLPVYVSARFRYAQRTWQREWAPPAHPLDQPSRARFKPHLTLPLGCREDPISALYLSAVWPHFRENTITDNAIYSELNPSTAPRWHISAKASSKPEPGRLETVLRSFAKLLTEDRTLNDLMGAAAAMDEDELSSKPSAGAALDALAVSKAGNPLASGVLKNVQKVSRVGRELGARIGRAALREVIRESGGGAGALSDDDLDYIMSHMFVEPAEKDSADQRPQAKHKDTPKLDLPQDCKTADRDSLTSEIANYLACVCGQAGGLASLATLWHEIVAELRWHWENLVPLHLPENDHITQSACLIQQKIEMIHYCIRRQIKHNKLKGIPVQSSAVKNGSSSSDDEFYLCPEDDEAAARRLEAIKSEADKPANVERTASSAFVEPRGVKCEHPSYRLLHVDQPLRIPVTQDPGPMTEDMIARHLEQLSGVESADERTRMQSMSLKSDMEAFKAANPGATLADFVRWHSPRDFVLIEADSLASSTASEPKMDEEPGDENDAAEQAANHPEDGDSGSDEDETDAAEPAAEPGNEQGALPYRLSERMSDPDCIWQELWREAMPVPVKNQRQLFDCTTEAERALGFLESVQLCDMAHQLLPSVLLEALRTVAAASPASLDALWTELRALAHMLKGLGHDLDNDRDRIEDILGRFRKAEIMLSQYDSAMDKLGTELGELAPGVVFGKNATVLTEAHRKHAQFLFFGSKEAEAVPENREFIIRTLVSGTSGERKPLAHRMFAELGDDHFILAGGFSEDMTLAATT